jgi:hypothetical protein
MSFVDTPQPARWKPVTGVVVVVTASYLGTCLLSVLAFVWDYSVMDSLTSYPTTGDPATIEGLRRLLDTLSLVGTIGFWTYLVAYVLWLVTVLSAARSFGIAGAGTLRHWTVVAWPVGMLASIITSVVVAARIPTSFHSLGELREAALRMDREAMIDYSLKAVVAALLLACVFVVAGRLRRLTERSEHAAHLTNPIYPGLPGYPNAPGHLGTPGSTGASEAAGVNVGDQDGSRA